MKMYIGIVLLIGALLLALGNGYYFYVGQLNLQSFMTTFVGSIFTAMVGNKLLGN